MAVRAHSTTVRPFQALSTRKQRQTLEAALERLLSAVNGILADLDALDGDADLEPSLGSIESWSAPQTRWAAGNSIDLEGEHDGREPAEDDEFTLGRTEGIDQTRPQWGSDDAEDVSEDEGAQCEDEGAGEGV